MLVPALYCGMPQAIASGELSTEELRRYHRHLTLPGVGIDGQRRLQAARILLVGAGGLGSPVALYLAAAGVGTLGIIDFDVVDASNLQRQILHGTSDVGRPKTDSARERLHDVNPHVAVETHRAQLSSANAMEILGEYDLVVDGSDNFQTRYLVNDACVLLGKPYVYGSIIRFEGQASVFGAPDGPCYRCLFREPPPAALIPNCAEGGVLGVLPGLVGTIQATEAIKLVIGAGDPLIGRLLLVDALRMRFRTIELRRDPQCPACGTREITELVDYEAFCGPGSGPGASSAASTADVGTDDSADTDDAAGTDDIAPAALARRFAQSADIDLIDVREPYEWQLARIEGARLIPLRTLPAALSTLARDREIVVYCHHGMRSAAAAELLRRSGFTRVRNLAGGIDRWSAEVDAAVPRY